MSSFDLVASFTSKFTLKGIKKFFFKENITEDAVLKVLSEQPIFSGLNNSQLKILKNIFSLNR